MTRPSLLGPCVRTVETVLKEDGVVNGLVGGRVNDDTVQRPTYPYIRVESAEELSLNTMGARTQPKFGSEATVRIRVCSQYRGEREVNDICAAVMDALDGHRQEIEGFAGRPYFHFARTTPLQDSVGAVITREWLMEFDIVAHQ